MRFFGIFSRSQILFLIFVGLFEKYEADDTANTTTIAPTTLPNVDVNYTDFKFVSCDASTCTYRFDTPHNDQSVLSEEAAAVDEDEAQYENLTAKAQQMNEAAFTEQRDALKKIQELQATLDSIVAELKGIQANIVALQQQQTVINIQMDSVDGFINAVKDLPSSCLYQKCLIPTTTPKPTTTPTPPPTTTPGRCFNFTCPGDTPADHCQLDSNGEPFCDNCDGDLSGYSNCNSVTCNASGSNFTFNSSLNFTRWFSYGYNQLNQSVSTIPASSNCVWFLPGDKGFEVGAFNLTAITSDVTLSLSNDLFTTRIRSTTTTRQLKSAFAIASANTKLTLTTTTNSAPAYAYIDLKPLAAASKPEKFRFIEWLGI